MFELIRTYQLDIMLVLCAACMTIVLLLTFTRFLPKRRRSIMILLELTATLLLASDRMAYRYAGDMSSAGYVMVRLSNFMVFFLTSGIVLCFNLFLIDWLGSKKDIGQLPKRLSVVNYGAGLGMVLVVASQFTGLFYYIDAQNCYQRGPGFLLSFIIPILCPLLQFSVIIQYRRHFSRLIFSALVLYIFAPIVMALLQIYSYGLSLVNMAMVLVSVGLYIFTYLDINDEVERVHHLELDKMEEAQSSMKKVFDHIADVLVTEREKKEPALQGHAVRVADYARRLAKLCGKDEEECEKVYYAAMLHEVEELSVMDKMTQSEEEIKEIGSIIAVCDACDRLRTITNDGGAMPLPLVREELLKGAGTLYDPGLIELLVQLIDVDNEEEEQAADFAVERELECGRYREKTTRGIDITENVTRIRFSCTPRKAGENFSAPVVLLFDANDRRVHDSRRTILEHSYLEYGELWFDGHYVCTAARNIASEAAKQESGEDEKDSYLITAARYEDHMKLKLENGGRVVSLVVALPDSTRNSYIGLSGENCHIRGIEIEKTSEHIGEEDIRRIADEVSFIRRLESDVPNVQVDRFRSAYTQGVPVRNGMRLVFHSMSLPTATLIWHCPHIILYTSADGKVGGEGYRELSVVKLNGENDNPLEGIENSFFLKKKESFPGWEGWVEANRSGQEYELDFKRNKKRIRYTTENQGILIENTTFFPEGEEEVYVTITGDQCALTDIRVLQ
ncbi:MAG: diguanylate cyclase [Lachnospiraceae bacterium]|nr:diguanylate cyclase [Lachnospiraceae bacterium]